MTLYVCKDAGQFGRCGLLPDGSPAEDRAVCLHAAPHVPWRYGEQHCGGECAGEPVWCVREEQEP